MLKFTTAIIYLFGLAFSTMVRAEVRPGQKLSCSYQMSVVLSQVNSVSGPYTKQASASVNLEYVLSPNNVDFGCVAGCAATAWEKTSDPSGQFELLSDRLLLPGNAPGFSFPKISLVHRADFEMLRIESEARLKSSQGRILRQSEVRLFNLRSKREIIEGPEATDAVPGSDHEDALMAKSKKTGRDVYESSHSFLDLRCELIKEGQMSKTDIQSTLASKPAPGKISFSEYDNGKNDIIFKLDVPFLQTLKSANQVDQRHRKAALAKWQNETRLMEAVRASVPDMLTLIQNKPNIQNDEIGYRFAQKLGIQAGMTPTFIVASSVLPFVILESCQNDSRLADVCHWN